MKFASILIITICLSLMGCRGGSSDDTPPKQYAPTQVFQFKSTPTNFVLIGNTYSYSPIPKDTFFNEDFYILSAVIDGVDLSMQFSGNKEITWTPLSSDIGKEIEFSVNVTSGDFINLKHTWRVQVVNPEEIKTGEINGDDFVFEKLTELKGYQLTIPSTNELQEVATKLSFTNVNLTSGQFEGKQSPAFVLELSGGNLATKDGAGVALKINLTEAGLSPAADDEVYYLVSQWQQSDGQSSDDDSGFNIIQMNEDNNTLNGFLQAINNPYSNTDLKFVGQLFKSKALLYDGLSSSYDIYWVFSKPSDVDQPGAKEAVNAYLEKAYIDFETSKAAYENMGCTSPNSVKVFVNPHFKNFTRKISTRFFFFEIFPRTFISIQSRCINDWGANTCSQEAEPLATQLQNVANEMRSHVVAHEYFHAYQAESDNSNLLELPVDGPLKWITESTADYAANKVFPNNVYLSDKLSYFNEALILDGLTSYNKNQFPNASADRLRTGIVRKYQQSLFLEFISSRRNSPLNICDFIKNDEYKTAHIKDVYENSLKTKDSLYAPLDRALNGNGNLTKLTEAYAEYILEYSYQDTINFPEMQYLQAVAFQPFSINISSSTSAGAANVPGGFVREFYSESETSVTLNIQPFFSKTPISSGGEFLAKLYKIEGPNSSGPYISTRQLIDTFDHNHSSSTLTFEAQSRYALIVVQSDFNRMIESEPLTYEIDLLTLNFQPGRMAHVSGYYSIDDRYGYREYHKDHKGYEIPDFGVVYIVYGSLIADSTTDPSVSVANYREENFFQPYGTDMFFLRRDLHSHWDYNFPPTTIVYQGDATLPPPIITHFSGDEYDPQNYNSSYGNISLDSSLAPFGPHVDQVSINNSVGDPKSYLISYFISSSGSSYSEIEVYAAKLKNMVLDDRTLGWSPIAIDQYESGDTIYFNIYDASTGFNGWVNANIIEVID